MIRNLLAAQQPMEWQAFLVQAIGLVPASAFRFRAGQRRRAFSLALKKLGVEQIDGMAVLRRKK